LTVGGLLALGFATLLVGLAIIISVYRNRRSVSVEDVDMLKW